MLTPMPDLGKWVGWSPVVVILAAWSIGLTAHLSTSVVLLVMGMAPAAVLQVILAGKAAPTLAALRSVRVGSHRSVTQSSSHTALGIIVAVTTLGGRSWGGL
jgi:hypothetical protein